MASAAAPNMAFRFWVEFEAREDGGLRAHSDDVKGFVLSHRDCDKVLANVEPVLATILSEMFESPVRVSMVADIRDRLEDAGVIRPKRIGKIEYVSQQIGA